MITKIRQLNFIVIFGLLMITPLYANINSPEISGVVIDQETGAPVAYATVALKSSDGSQVITGTITDENGQFRIERAEDAFIEVRFIGYAEKLIEISKETPSTLGEISIAPDTKQLEEVVISGERSTVEFKLDKRVFNVGKDLSTTGMGALEVLNNVPSVNVDIEGQVTLRGNAGVQILINGKPSVLADSQNNALGSITADMIESVEVITNPSAKYEAEGTSGIINIILKKEEKKGINGSVSLNTGTPDNHSVGASLNKRTENFNFFTQFGGGYRSLPRYREGLTQNFIDNTSLLTEGTEYRNEGFYNMTLGADYYFNEKNIVTFSGNYAHEFEDQPSETNYWFYSNPQEIISQWKREETTSAGNPKWQFDMQYEKEFENNKDHKLLLIAQGSFFGKEQSSEFTNTAILGTEVNPDQQSETEFHQTNYIFKADYSNPLNDQLSLEAGAAYEINNVGNDYIVYDWNNNDWVANAGLTNNFEYEQKVLGVYSTGAYEGDKWGLKLGLRLENTILQTLLVTTNEANNQDYTKLFPTVHSSYKFTERISLQAGYSRRTYRPRLWDLNPFFNVRDEFNIYQGNPNLKPEYADSYELTWIFAIPKASFNASAYYLYTTDKVERVTTSENNVSLRMPMNIGTDKKTGASIYAKYNVTKWVSLNGDFNYGYFKREGEFDGKSFDFNGDQWSGRITSKFKLKTGTELELSGNLNSRVKTVQGEISGAAFANAGLRQKIMNGKVIVNIGVRDIFNSRGRENFIEQEDYSIYSFSERGRFITFGISYGFGKGEAMSYSGRRR